MASKNNSPYIPNPFVKLKGYNCFGCSPNNPLGLHMLFTQEGDEIVSVWTPQHYFQGYFKILHGGIQATLMDEIASWVVIVQLHSAGYTSKAEIRYHKTVFVDKGPITLRARSVGMRRNLADIEVRLLDVAGIKCASGLFTYFTYPENSAREKMFS